MTDFICNDIIELIGKEVNYIRAKKEEERIENIKINFNDIINHIESLSAYWIYSKNFDNEDCYTITRRNTLDNDFIYNVFNIMDWDEDIKAEW